MTTSTTAKFALFDRKQGRYSNITNNGPNQIPHEGSVRIRQVLDTSLMGTPNIPDCEHERTYTPAPGTQDNIEQNRFWY